MSFINRKNQQYHSQPQVQQSGIRQFQTQPGVKQPQQGIQQQFQPGVRQPQQGIQQQFQPGVRQFHSQQPQSQPPLLSAISGNQQLQKEYAQLQAQHQYQAQLQQAQLQQMKFKQTQRVKEISNSNIIQKVQEVNVPKQEEITGKFKDMTSDEIINLCYSTFKEIYKNRVKKTKIESIINGEIITTNPDNIFVDSTTFDDPGFEKKLELCKKKLYPYQINAIKMIRQLELSESYVTKNGETIYSNAFLLHLPIGSGKTVIFMHDTLVYRDIPPKPIIISTSGAHIPEDKMIQLKFYPYYYENVGYIVDASGNSKENCIVAIKDYVQRKMTVVITHLHLIDQLIDYIHSDFVPGLYNPQVNKIVTAMSPSQIDLNCNVLIVPAKPEIIDRLSMLSCDQPFMRVIVDDYTNMPNIEQYRQIRATFTLFVSGSGFERDIDKIPPSYFTLRHIEVDKFSLVASPEETSKGILRNNVVTFNLVGAQNEFSKYKLANEIDEHCMAKYRLVASNLYSQIVKNNGRILDYLVLNFILKNYDKLNKSITMILADVENGKLSKDKVEWFLKWKEELNKQCKVIALTKDAKGHQTKVEQEIDNPLYDALFKPINQAPQGIQPMLLMNCSICGKLPQEHKGWGFISSCCGSFFCTECAKAMVTRDLVLYPENDMSKSITIHDDNHYYCVVCHKFDPTYVSNSTRNKDQTQIQTHHIVDDYMDNSELKGHLHVDYYFKMFMDGFKPKYFDGKVIECEIQTNAFEEFKKNGNSENLNEIIEQLIPKDQLALSCIERINKCLKRLEINPAKMNTIKPQLLVYGCPNYMQKRVTQYFNMFASNPKKNLYSLNILFKNSLSELIGLHQNILGILVWNNPKHIDEIQQLIGRIVRLNNWNNPVYFYVTCTGGVDEKGEEVNNINNADNVESKKLGQTTGDMIAKDSGNSENENGLCMTEDTGNGNMLTILKGTIPKILDTNAESGGLNFGF